MLILQIVVLALIQGITEFLPISSSGHLLLVPIVTGWPDQGVLTDVMVHMGSFLAVVVYFWKDCVNMLAGLVDMVRGRKNAWGRLAFLLVLGTIPAVVLGVILDENDLYADEQLGRIAREMGFADELSAVIDRLGR